MKSTRKNNLKLLKMKMITLKNKNTIQYSQRFVGCVSQTMFSSTGRENESFQTKCTYRKKYNHKIFTIYFKYVYLRKDFKKPATATEGLVQLQLPKRRGLASHISNSFSKDSCVLNQTLFFKSTFVVNPDSSNRDANFAKLLNVSAN